MHNIGVWLWSFISQSKKRIISTIQSVGGSGWVHCTLKDNRWLFERVDTVEANKACQPWVWAIPKFLPCYRNTANQIAGKLLYICQNFPKPSYHALNWLCKAIMTWYKIGMHDSLTIYYKVSHLSLVISLHTCGWRLVCVQRKYKWLVGYFKLY